jgi:hypothetical protein
MFGFLTLVDVPRVAADVTDLWYNQTLCHVNGCVPTEEVPPGVGETDPVADGCSEAG